MNTSLGESVDAGLKSYEYMKDSGVEWLGKIPGHWEVRKLKHWLGVNQQTLSDDTDPDYMFDYIDIGSVGTGHLVSPPQRLQFRSCPSRARRIVRSGDTIISTVRTYLKAVWYAKKVESDVIASTGFAVLTPKPSTCAQFVSYLCQNEHFTNRVTANSVGIAYPAIAETKLAAFKVVVPPLPEQKAITHFLDYATGRIERHIRAKEKLIALLGEQKQVIIHDAVTGRFDVRTNKFHPSYKESGIKWLGRIPADWKVQRVKSLFRLRIEKSGSAHGRELLSVYTHIGVRPRKDLEEKGNKASTTDDYWIVKKGDLIANKLLAWMGAIGVSHYDGVTSPAYDILIPIANLESDYYHHLFRTKAYLQQFKQRSRGIMDMRLRLYFDQFGQILVPVPPRGYQKLIVNWYNRFSRKIGCSINEARHEIDLLREYRTRLVADVVTGKLDVREAAKALPDDLEEANA